MDLQRTAVEHLGEARTHLRMEEANKGNANDELHRLLADLILQFMMLECVQLIDIPSRVVKVFRRSKELL